MSDELVLTANIYLAGFVCSMVLNRSGNDYPYKNYKQALALSIGWPFYFAVEAAQAIRNWRK